MKKVTVKVEFDVVTEKGPEIIEAAVMRGIITQLDNKAVARPKDVNNLVVRQYSKEI